MTDAPARLPGTMTEILAVIDSPARGKSGGFNCAIVLWDDVVIEAAPIVHYMKRQKWTRARVRAYCTNKGWTVSVVSKTEREKP